MAFCHSAPIAWHEWLSIAEVAIDLTDEGIPGRISEENIAGGGMVKAGTKRIYSQLNVVEGYRGNKRAKRA